MKTKMGEHYLEMFSTRFTYLLAKSHNFQIGFSLENSVGQKSCVNFRWKCLDPDPFVLLYLQVRSLIIFLFF